MNQLTISIDFDDTFTADPVAWTKVIQILQQSGHRVICVSARRSTVEHRLELTQALPEGVTVLLSYDAPKRLYAESRGFRVDIWVDDMPESIPTKRELERMCG